MSKRNDITTPEGYFGDLQKRLSEIPARPVRVSMVHRLAPYAAIAASFLVAVMLGNAILRHSAPASAEDIVNYLLADGISVEHLNYLSYEEGY